MAAEGEFPKADGDVLYASEANTFHSKIKQIYTGSGFDSSQSTAGNTEASQELTAVTSSINDYVKIIFTGVSDTFTTDGLARTEVKAQIKETGGVYGDVIAYKVLVDQDFDENFESSYSYMVIATLTSGQKTNGYQIKVFSKSTTTGTSTPTASYTNIQTVVEEA